MLKCYESSGVSIDSDFSYLYRYKIFEYLKDKYGEDCVSSIGTITELGIKNGLKDVGRALNIDFMTMNELTKEIDIITEEEPGFNFKKIDKLKDGNENEIIRYERFCALENSHKELFRLARRFEGIPRNSGIHASGVLITPKPINNAFPTRMDKNGNLVTINTGEECEKLGGVKIDVLGLRTLDILNISIKSVDENKNIYDLYDIVNKHLEDKNLFNKLNNLETEGIFQLESNLFKSLISEIPQSSLESITSLTALGRPGPLKALLHKVFANRLAGIEKATPILEGVEDITKDTHNVLVYQEHCMRIAQRVAGFDDNQADSFLRKAMA